MNDSAINLPRLVFVLRMIVAMIWMWSAIDAWFFYPHATSLSWLRIVGFTSHTDFWFAASCALDLLMGFGALFFPRRLLWGAQMILVAAYSIVIGIDLPEFVFHPFAPVIKNLAVLGCLYVLFVTAQKESHDRLSHR